MTEETVVMSKAELQRLEVVQDVEIHGLTQRQAAERLGLSVRQVKRLVGRYREQGPKGLVSRRRGRPSNRAKGPVTRRQALAFLRDGRGDFGPTLACEHVERELGIQVSRETMRQWMIEAGLWKPRRRRAPSIHLPRTRRPRWGELVQVDGSLHCWFEGRGDACSLLLFVDDATSQIMVARFVPAETTASYMELLRESLDRYGRPLCLYSDRHSIFRVNRQGVEGERTQFGRACADLGIGLIHARSSQAKGRVERCFGTLQDRLVKEMRVRGLCDMQAANAYLPEFIEKFNVQFSKPPACAEDAHRPVLHSKEEQDRVFAHQEERTLSKNLTFQFRNNLYHVPPANGGIGYAMRGAKVTVCAPYCGEISALYKGRVLAVRQLREGEKPTPVADEKTLNPLVDRAVAAPKSRWRPAADHPWRRMPIGRAARPQSPT